MDNELKKATDVEIHGEGIAPFLHVDCEAGTQVVFQFSETLLLKLRKEIDLELEMIEQHRATMAEQKFEYMLLARLQMDCEYFTDHPSAKHLWAGNVEDQIAKMKELWEILKIKPEWIAMDEINQYEQQMIEAAETSTPTK